MAQTRNFIGNVNDTTEAIDKNKEW